MPIRSRLGRRSLTAGPGRVAAPIRFRAGRGRAARAFVATRHHTAPPDRPVNSATAPPSDGAVNSVEAGPLRTAARSPDAAVERPPSAGNPLWALPLKQLSITRDRPVFSPSSRPPPPATPTSVAPVAVRSPPKPVEPKRPSFTLL